MELQTKLSCSVEDSKNEADGNGAEDDQEEDEEGFEKQLEEDFDSDEEDEEVEFDRYMYLNEHCNKGPRLCHYDVGDLHELQYTRKC